MRKIGFAILFIVFIIASANSKTKGAEDDLPDRLQEKLEKKITKLLKRVDKIAKKEIKEWENDWKQIRLLAQGIYHENWHTDKEKKTARWTGGVVMNRVESPDWPNTVEGVLYQKGQYSTTKKFFTVDLPDECYEMAKDIYYNGVPEMPKTVVFQATFRQGKGVWQVLNGEYFCYG